MVLLDTEKAVSNFFKPASQKEPDKITWRVVNDTLLVGKYHGSSAEARQDTPIGKQKIAAFDFVYYVCLPGIYSI
jgi:bifunctional polynucleotide phosphatase/kinase